MYLYIVNWTFANSFDEHEMDAHNALECRHETLLTTSHHPLITNGIMSQTVKNQTYVFYLSILLLKVVQSIGWNGEFKQENDTPEVTKKVTSAFLSLSHQPDSSHLSTVSRSSLLANSIFLIWGGLFTDWASLSLHEVNLPGWSL